MAIVISRIHVYVVFMLLLAAGLAGLWYAAGSALPYADAESRFMRECVEVADNLKPLPETCRSEDSIRQAYGGLDVRVLIEKKRSRMSATARRIASGELQDPLRYKECIARGECAAVPLLPPALSGADIAQLTPTQQQISAAFWDLAEGDMLTAPVCESIPECRVLHSSGAFDFGF